MLAVCAGMPGAGSTWLYNTARGCAESAGEPYSVRNLFRPASSVVTPGARFEFVKTHHWDPKLALEADVVLTCHRDAAEAYESFSRRFDVPFRLQWIRKAEADYARWAAVAAYDMPYETLTGEPEAAVSAVASALGLGGRVDAAAVLAWHPEPTAGGKGYDPLTMYFDNHRRSGGG